MSRQLLCGLFIFIFLASQSSCILFKRGTKQAPTADSTEITALPDTLKTDTLAIAAVDKNKLNLIETFSPVWKSGIDFNTFSGKAKMHFEGRDQKQDFTAHFRIKKNEVIWASITALGGIMQVARVYITPDSFKLINYLDKEVTEMPLADASKVLPAPADFSTLQNLIIGTALRNTGTITDAADLGAIVSLQAEEENLIQQINLNRSDSTINTLQMRTGKAGGPSGMIQFSGYERVDGRKFPMNRSVNVINEGEQYNLEMNFNKADFDKPTDFPFSIPKNYKRK